MLNTNQEKSIIDFFMSSYTLPKSGLVAGQAVASMIYKTLGLNLNAPINDVDVFVNYNKERLLPSAKCRKEDFDVVTTHKFKGSCGDFVSTSAFVRNYEIIRSYMSKEDNDVNIIEIKTKGNVNKKVVDSFDFNCCSVGFDLETKEFTYSSAFIDFVKTKQLRVQSVHTPFHTWLRLNKKLKDLGSVYCNLNLEHFVLIKAMQINNNKYSNFIVGERFLELREKYGDKEFDRLAEYYLYQDENNEDTEYFDSYFNKQKYKKIQFSKAYLETRYYQEEIDHPVNPMSKLMIQEMLRVDKTYEESDVFWGLNSVATTNMIHLLYMTNLFDKKYVKKMMDFYDSKNCNEFYRSLMNTLMEETPLSKFKGDIPIRFINRISKLLKNHVNLIHAVHSENNKDSSALDILKNLEKIYLEVKKNPEKEFLIGFLESNSVSLKSIIDVLYCDTKTITNKLIDFENENLIKEKLVFKKYNQFKLFGLEIKQLETVEDFYNAGRESKHCIFGHFNFWLTSDSYRYFRMNFFGKISCLQIKNEQVIQHYRFKNSMVSSIECFIGKLLGLYCIKDDKEKIKIALKYMYHDCRYRIKSNLIRWIERQTGKNYSNSKLIRLLDKDKCFMDDIPF